MTHMLHYYTRLGNVLGLLLHEFTLKYLGTACEVVQIKRLGLNRGSSMSIY